MREVILTVTVRFDDDGSIDVPYITASVDHAINKAKAEGAITPDDDAHAALISYSVS